MSATTVAVVGNPNCGKTTLFNALTGSRQRVGNWPGVTVDRKVGRYRHAGDDVELVDLPGIYSLSAHSLDERVAREYLLSGEPDLVVNIVDAANLERNLYLTSQLLEMGVPLVVAVNMVDVAKHKGLAVDTEALAERLGCPVVPLVAAEGQGVPALREAVARAAAQGRPPRAVPAYPEEVEAQVDALVDAMGTPANTVNPRWMAIKLLEGDAWAEAQVPEAARERAERGRAHIEEVLDEETDIVVADARYGAVRSLLEGVLTRTGRASRDLSDRIDRVVLNRALGIPIFLVVMYLMFMFTINVGGAFIDFFDQLAGTIFVDGTRHLLEQVGSPAWLTALLADGVGGGIATVATFIPPVGFLFLFLSALEDSGYMARAAFVMDRFMRFIGLPGKSFVPMLVGFGCNVPGIMATRTLEHERDRLLTIMMNPFMSCGARLPVYALFAAAFFPVGGQNVVFGLYLLGIAFAVLTGLVMKNTLLRGEAAPFIMELPPYHLPTLKGVGLRTYDRVKTFIVRAGKVIVAMVVVLSFLNTLGTDGSFGNQDSDKSVLANIGRSITPAFAPMGIDEDNWPATVGIFTGVFAKEAVVGTLDALYSQMGTPDMPGEAEETEGFDLWGGIAGAFATIPENLAAVADSLLDPLGVSVGDTSSLDAAAAEQGVKNATFGAMVAMFDGQVGAFAYLLFILLYFPCVAATAAVYRETNWRWTALVAAWTTGLAYMASTLFYQTATFAQHPASSGAWIGGLLSTFGAVILWLRLAGRREAAPPAVLAGEGRA